ncbi:hypothetical protein BGZ95_009053, partial [Linnemannia exigua]
NMQSRVRSQLLTRNPTYHRFVDQKHPSPNMSSSPRLWSRTSRHFTMMSLSRSINGTQNVQGIKSSSWSENVFWSWWEVHQARNGTAITRSLSVSVLETSLRLHDCRPFTRHFASTLCS